MANFQTRVNKQPAPGQPGDVAGNNPRMSQIAPGSNIGWIAADTAVTVGNFAWGDPATGLIYSAYASGRLLGFVHRVQGNTVIVAFLDPVRETIQEGFPVNTMSRGEFWVSLVGGAAFGAQVYADATTGAPTLTSSGNRITPFKVAGSGDVAAATFTGVIALNDSLAILTASSVTGVISPGAVLTGTGVAKYSTIVSQLTGSAGAAGTYVVSNNVAVASTAMTATGGQMAKISSWQV